MKYKTLVLLTLINPILIANESSGILENGLKKGQEQIEKLKESDSFKKGKDIGNETIKQGKGIYQTVVGKRSSAENRDQSHISLFYMPMNYGLLLPTKSGFAGAWIVNRSFSIEAEYLSAGYGFSYLDINLVDLSEKLISLNAKWYIGNSFNLKMGYGQRKFNFEIGDQLLVDASQREIETVPTLKVSNDFIALGLGNRWQFDNGITWGFDWFDLIIPLGHGETDKQILSYIKNDNDRKNTESVIDYMEGGLSFNAMKLHIGYTF